MMDFESEDPYRVVSTEELSEAVGVVECFHSLG